MIITDTHVHVYPEKIAAKASAGIGAFYGGMPMRFDGSVPVLNSVRKAAGVHRCVICSVATKPEQAEGINRFLQQTRDESGGEFSALLAMHPLIDARTARDILQAGKEAGFVGVKLHPDFQRFAIDDRNVYHIYEAASDLRLPILFHTGDKRFDFSAPHRLKSVLADFPKLVAVGAHFGGWSEWEEAARVLPHTPNLFVDTCSSLYAFSPEKARDMINKFGAENVLFGSDYPMWDPADELRMLQRAGLPDRDLELILSENVKRLY